MLWPTSKDPKMWETQSSASPLVPCSWSTRGSRLAQQCNDLWDSSSASDLRSKTCPSKASHLYQHQRSQSTSVCFCLFTVCFHGLGGSKSWHPQRHSSNPPDWSWSFPDAPDRVSPPTPWCRCPKKIAGWWPIKTPSKENKTEKWPRSPLCTILGVSKNSGGPPKIIHFNRVFPYKPAFLGGPPIFGCHSYHLKFMLGPCLGQHFRVGVTEKGWVATQQHLGWWWMIG